MIVVELPLHLRALARLEGPVELEVEGEVTLAAVLDALEAAHPMLRGTIRDHGSGARRPFLRFFACNEDWSHRSPHALLPEPVRVGSEPLYVVGAIVGG